MAFDARVFRILIASPSDVSDEREIAVRTIQEWNDRFAAERNIVLLPLRWETHSAPEFGRRPQEVINRQVVDHADMLVGIFWTRIGSPTGIAESGTLEEIERVANDEKLVMLYFSKVKQNPDNIDTKQLDALREFKSKTFPRALIDSYESQVEFRDKLARHIDAQVKQLASEVASGDHPTSAAQADIEFEFADLRTGARLGRSLDISTTLFDAINIDKIPDYSSEKEGATLLGSGPNKDYNRDMLRYFINQNAFRPIRFWFKNIASIGLRDIFAEIRISSISGTLLDVRPLSHVFSPPRTDGSNFWFKDPTELTFKKSGDIWSSQLEFSALQPQREYSPQLPFAVCPASSGEIQISARIYADIFATPLERVLTINCDVNSKQVEAEDIFEDAKAFIQQQRRVAG